jgi:hypothetical protein
MRFEFLRSAGGEFRLVTATRLPFLVLVVAGAVVASGAGEDDPPPTTVIDDVIMYGVDDDTDQLLRYAFGADDYYVVGSVRDEDGNLVDEVEALGYIPSGPHKGLYGATNYDGNERAKLVKFNMFTGNVSVYPVDIGFGNIEGMVAAVHPQSGEWTLYATQTGDSSNADKVTLCHVPPGNPDNAHTITVGAPAVPAHLAHGDTLGPCPGDGEQDSARNLIVIDPATGQGALLMALGNKFEGLAKGPDGALYAARNNELWRIDPFNCPGLTLLGSHAHENVEALEYAFGDYDPHIEVPGVPEDWTSDGILFGFSDTENAMLILNAASGAAVQLPCAVDTTDCEGIVFLTELSDPFGEIVVGPCD